MDSDSVDEVMQAFEGNGEHFEWVLVMGISVTENGPGIRGFVKAGIGAALLSSDEVYERFQLGLQRLREGLLKPPDDRPTDVIYRFLD